MKRRALLAGLLLMPTAAHARTTRQPTKAATRKVAPAQPPLRPLKEAKSQLVAFNTSAFPYRGLLPKTNKPFLDVRDGKRRGHTSLRGDVYWEDTAYSDRRTLLHLPAGFDPSLPSLLVLYLHGQGATLERDVMVRQAVPRQLDESGLNAALVAPQLAFDAGDSSAGNFWKLGHFAAFVDEAAERLMRLHGDRRVGPRLNAAPVLIVSYSGGYVSAAYALARGGAGHRLKGVILMDSLYGEEDKIAAWIALRRKQAFLFSAFTESTREENGTLKGLLAKRRIAVTTKVPAALTSGTVAMVDCGPWEMHGNFVTQAWAADPLRSVLARIPGYPRMVRGKKSG